MRQKQPASRKMIIKLVVDKSVKYDWAKQAMVMELNYKLASDYDHNTSYPGDLR